MNKSKHAERISTLLLSLFLVITILSSTPIPSAGAKEVEAIPNQIVTDYLLLQNQSVTASLTSTSSTDSHTISVTSIGNNTLSASLSVSDEGTTGYWWVLILGTGGKHWIDLAVGIIPVTGSNAIIDISDSLSLGLITGGVILTSPLPGEDEDPLEYSITVSGAWSEGS